jgi:hypothetical protein
MAQIDYAPFWKQETEAAAMPGVNEFGTKLFSNCRQQLGQCQQRGKGDEP